MASPSLRPMPVIAGSIQRATDVVRALLDDDRDRAPQFEPR